MKTAPKSGCELLTAAPSSPHSQYPLQQIREAYLKSTSYFTITHLDSRRGYGAIACIDIPEHTLILDEPPLLPCDELQAALVGHANGSLACHEDDDAYLRRYFERVYRELNTLNGDEKHKMAEVQTLIDLFWSMHDQYAINDDKEAITSDRTQKRIWGINYSNAFFNTECNESASKATTTYMPTIHFLAAKLNHSCKPNVGYDFNKNNLRMFTTRHIKKGEELCDCYSDVVYHEPSYVRQLFLKTKYHFDCQCAACAYPTLEEQEESDDRRMRLKEMAISLSDCIGATFLYNESFAREVRRITAEYDSDVEDDETSWGESSNIKSKKTLRPTLDDMYTLLEYLHLLNQEGIDHDILECIELAFDLAVFLSDKEKCKELGENALNLYMVTKGEKHKKTRLFRKKMVKVLNR